jgi:hypothetical protein
MDELAPPWPNAKPVTVVHQARNEVLVLLDAYEALQRENEAAVDERDQLAVTLTADGKLLTRILRALHPECIAFPGSPNQCEWTTCDCSASDDLDHQVAALQRQLQEADTEKLMLVRHLTALGTRIAQAEARLVAFTALKRENFHATYNGGWHGNKDGLRAFHHGMDTVFNALDEAARLQAAGGGAP